MDAMRHGSDNEDVAVTKQIDDAAIAGEAARIGGETTLRPMRDVIAELSRDHADVSHSSLRFLEREGLIAPARTPGGHRLFSDADVARVRQIKRWQGQRLSLDEIRVRLAELDRLPATDHLADRFLRYAIAGDRAAAFRTVLQADDAGMPLVRVMDEVLRPALTELGRLWENNEILVAQEKEVSELTRDLIAELVWRHTVPEEHGPVIIAACVEDELHELGIRMIAGLLRTEGFVVHYLGADVPPWFLLDASLLRRPDAVLLSGQSASRLSNVKETVDLLKARMTEAAIPPIIVGGRMAFEHAETLQSWRVIPVLEYRLESALTAIMALLPPPTPR